MAALFGDKQRFVAEVGEFWEKDDQRRRVDLWAAARWLVDACGFDCEEGWLLWLTSCAALSGRAY